MYTVNSKRKGKEKGSPKMKKVNNLNENEIKAMNAILETCDDIDGE